MYEDEDIESFIEYCKKYKKIPLKNYFEEFFVLFESGIEKVSKEFEETMKLTENKEVYIKVLLSKKPKYNGYNEFVDYCLDIFKNNKTKDVGGRMCDK